MGRYVILFVALAVVIGIGFWWTGSTDDDVATTTDNASRTNGPMVDVVLPETLSANAEIGKLAFEAKCAVCHGANATGQDGVAPPLVYKIYEPSHHGDAAFLLAAKNGVRAHHWGFGNMPPVEGVTDGDVKMIVAYVRELQRANGID
jgi:mono/diheme cytochrome c family protein